MGSIADSMLGAVGMPVLFASHGIPRRYCQPGRAPVTVKSAWMDDTTQIISTPTGEAEQIERNCLVSLVPLNTGESAITAINIESDYLVDENDDRWLVVEQVSRDTNVAELRLRREIAVRHAGQEYVER